MRVDSCALLISAANLARCLFSTSEPAVVIELASPAELAGEPTRIPGSRRAWRPDYELPLGDDQPLDGLCPTRDAFQAFARSHGIDDDTTVVIVDRKYDATRLWWLFVLFGKRNVCVLDGGYKAWVAGGWPLTLEEPSLGARLGTWTAAEPDRRLVATREEVLRLERRPSARLWDVRTVEEFRGALTLPGAARGGRIPWASARLDWDLFRAADGTWLSAADIEELALAHLGARPSDEAVNTFYCQSAVRTTQLIFGLHRAGWPLETLRNYDGSWVEWSHLAKDDDILVAG